MAGVIYLDIDDEITSAAARIRSAEGSRVAVVLPYGSRVATSRINFRLLARDALTNGKRLSIVAGDGATRALAASAGLPIFATVGEYESSLEDDRSGTEAEAGALAAAAASGVATGDAGPDAAAPVGGEDDAEGTLVSETVATPKAKGPASGKDRPATAPHKGRSTAGAAAAAGALAASAAAAGAATAGATSAGAATAGAAATTSDAGTAPTTDRGPRSSAPPRGEAKRAGRAPAVIPAARVVADTPAIEGDRPGTIRPEPVVRSFRPSIGRTPLVIALAVVALAVVVGGAAAFLYLPTATAVIAPREGTIGPESLRIVASTTATAPDAAASPPVVPAELLTIDVEASDTFPATGQRIEEAKATGSVRFDNLDPTSSNNVPRGSVVSTGSGIRFRTDRAVRVPPAELVGLTIVPSRASVTVTAVDAGPEGNVEPRAITTVPRDEEPFFLKVTNPDATSGGKRTEFPRVQQEDVDAATAALTDQLNAAFDERLDDPALPGDAATVFPETKTLGAPVYGVNPASLVGQEVETFDLSATGSGTVVAVDTSPVQAVAEARIASSVDPGYELISGSGQVVPAPAEISGGVITFPVVVTARQVLQLDPDAIEAEIMGKPLETGARDPQRLWRVPADRLARLGRHRPDDRVTGRRHHLRPGPGRDSERRTRVVAVTRALGIDLGERRIGVAIADGPDVGARPLTTLRRGRHVDLDSDALLALIDRPRDHRARGRAAHRCGRARGSPGGADQIVGGRHPGPFGRPCHHHPAR